MDIQDFSFILLSIIAILSAIGVVVLPNLVYSAFLLGSVLFSVAGFYLLLNADFLAAAQILLYVGAINILILFAIMLIDKRNDITPNNSTNSITIVKGALSFGLFVLLTQSIHSTPWIRSPFYAVTDSVYVIGRHIFSDFLLPFELVSILLLVALIGAIILARKEQLAKLKTTAFFQLPSFLLKD
jgi:NAD(P)H-quinone oxidoreductase subunit 6